MRVSSRLGLLLLVVTMIAGLTECVQASEGAERARQAISEDQAIAGPAIAALRERCQAGLAELLALRDQTAGESSRQKWSEGELARWQSAVDAVGGQRDCWASRLFWHTDLEQAQAEAERTGRPILSLHMLGKLTDEFSCANSRFFRATLYANRQVSDVLRERFVLHWTSVRPVPRVTIDFGDGRKLERTLTGNSIHYILDVQGRPVDALPGLYGPAAFLRGLERAEQLAKASAKLDAQEHAVLLSYYHRENARAISQAWSDDLQTLGVSVADNRPARAVDARAAVAAAVGNGSEAPPASAPTARAAAGRAMTKAVAEIPILAAITPTESLVEATDEETWARIAQLHENDVVLDVSSRELMRRHHFGAHAAGRLAITKKRVEDPLLRVVEQFQRSAALDTVRNEYLLHRQIHEWFMAGVPDSVQSLNERVYAELFLTPSTDPWLGLASPDTYTALEGNGVVN